MGELGEVGRDVTREAVLREVEAAEAEEVAEAGGKGAGEVVVGEE